MILKFSVFSPPKICATIVFLLCSVTIGAKAWALTPKVELDRYMLAAKAYIKGKDYPLALSYLDRAEELRIELPAEFFYYKALILQEKKKIDPARVAFEAYVEAAGPEGAHYRHALMQITLIENSVHQKPLDPITKPEIDWASSKGQLNNTSGEDYEESIKALYLADSSLEAFVDHLNSMLATYPYTGKRIVKANESFSVHNSISVDDGEHISIHKHHRAHGGTQITALKLPLYGISPSFKFSCDENTLKCRLLHADSLDTWFEISLDQDAIVEIQKAATQLLKIAQRSGSDQ